jgi:ribosomal-protein-alanine N-acetyltransferase
MNKITIRPVTLDDLAEILVIEQGAHVSPWSLSVFNGCFGKHSHNYLLEVDGDLAGYYFSKFIVGELILENICIAVEFQGKGLATRLMQHLLAQMEPLSAFDILLEVRASNQAAIGLYQKHGFHTQGVRKAYYPLPDGRREDAVLMNIKSD